VDAQTLRMTTYRRAQRGRSLVCDVCGALVEATEHSRMTHTSWHAAFDVIDLRERAEAARQAARR
jgi:hypothetical protein